MDGAAHTDGARLRRGPAAGPDPVRIVTWTGDRTPLRPLFELAEDSAEQLDSYVDAGTVLVAYAAGELVGHLQLVDLPAPEADRSAEVEVKNMAVAGIRQGQGIGRLLVAEAVRRAAAAGLHRVLVATAAADVGNLRFYQRQGFRMLSVERDAFVPATGYPDAVDIDGIPLRDRVWLDLDLRV